MGGKVNTKWLKEKTKETPTGSVDGSNTVFTLSQSPGATSEIEVYLDGLYETEYTFNSSTKEITFNQAPDLGQTIKAVFRPQQGFKYGRQITKLRS